MFIFRHPRMYFETPEAGSGGAATATQPDPGQGTPPQNGDFWGMFPNVPQEHRALLEPHLRQSVLPYVTQMEQQLAPFKPFIEVGVTADDARGLLQFATDYEKDPVNMWMRMGQQLQQEQKVHEDVDFDILGKIVRGEEIDEEPPAVPGNGAPPVDEMPAWAQQMAQQLQQLTSRDQEREQQSVTERQNAALEQAKTQMRTNLKEAGVPEESLTDELIIGSLIANRGDAVAAEKALLDYRTAALTGTPPVKPNGKQELETPNGTPPTPPRGSSRRGGSPKDEFSAVRGSAQQYLEAQQKAQGE